MSRNQGFSLIELSVVLIVLGIILGIGIMSWKMLIDSRKIAKTQSVLRQTKNCFLERMTYSLQYPKYIPSLTTDCDYNKSDVLGACLCKIKHKDAWGNRLRYLAGVNSSNTILAGFAIDRPYHDGTGISWNANDPGANSEVIVKDGRNVNHIAFVLISMGKNEKLDDISYNFSSSCFSNSMSLVGNLTNCNPDFTEGEDDQYLVVTGREIRGRLSD